MDRFQGDGIGQRNGLYLLAVTRPAEDRPERRRILQEIEIPDGKAVHTQAMTVVPTLGIIVAVGCNGGKNILSTVRLGGSDQCGIEWPGITGNAV